MLTHQSWWRLLHKYLLSSFCLYGLTLRHFIWWSLTFCNCDLSCWSTSFLVSATSGFEFVECSNFYFDLCAAESWILSSAYQMHQGFRYSVFFIGRECGWISSVMMYPIRCAPYIPSQSWSIKSSDFRVPSHPKLQRRWLIWPIRRSQLSRLELGDKSWTLWCPSVWCGPIYLWVPRTFFYVCASTSRG